jgi:hypothetical protein
MFCKVVVITEQAQRLRPVTLAATLLSKTFVSMDSMQAMCRVYSPPLLMLSMPEVIYQPCWRLYGFFWLTLNARHG